MREDIHVRTAPGAGDHGSDWKLYVGAVTPSNAKTITAALEAEGEHVRRFRTAKTLGRLTYETPAKDPAPAKKLPYYQSRIAERLAEIGTPDVDPRHVEGWMRLECSTLDGLDRARFNHEISIACQCIQAGPIADSESLAKSYGL